MPRRPRLDHPGALHHVTARGVGRCDLFVDDHDRRALLDAMRRVLPDSGTRCLAWAFMSNHVHLLLETGGVPISRVVQRLLTRHAMHFNRRHDRVGHLFQNRFHSVRVSSERHLLASVRYIHLNPVEAGVVRGIAALDRYAWTGHATLMGEATRGFQDVRGVLALFDADPDAARNAMREFVASGVGESAAPPHPEERPLPLSKRAQFEARSFGVRAIAARSRTIDAAVRRLDSLDARREAARQRGWTLDGIVRLVCRRLGVAEEDVVAGRKLADVAEARAVAACLACEHLGTTQSDAARRLGVTQPAVARGLVRGRRGARRMRSDLEKAPRLVAR